MVPLISWAHPVLAQVDGVLRDPIKLYKFGFSGFSFAREKIRVREADNLAKISVKKAVCYGPSHIK